MKTHPDDHMSLRSQVELICSDGYFAIEASTIVEQTLYSLDQEHMSATLYVRDDGGMFRAHITQKAMIFEVVHQGQPAYQVLWRTKLHLRKEDQVYVEFHIDGERALLDSVVLKVEFEDGYSYMNGYESVNYGMPQEVVDAGPSYYVDDENNLMLSTENTEVCNTLVTIDPDGSALLYDGQYALATNLSENNNPVMSLYHNNEERIRIHCDTGEIEFLGDEPLSRQARQGWKIMAEAFPAVFTKVERREELSTDEAQQAYKRAMEMVK